MDENVAIREHTPEKLGDSNRYYVLATGSVPRRLVGWYR
jgi:hypothetical protein